MNVPMQRTRAEAAYVDAFADGPAGPSWLGSARRAAFAQFAASGLPHRRLEDWKWTDLRRLVDEAFPPVAGGGDAAAVDALVRSSPFREVSRARLVFVDGRYDAGRSALPATGDVEVTHLGQSRPPAWLKSAVSEHRDDPIAVLNTAFVSDGAAIRIAAGSSTDAPIEIVNVTTVSKPATVTTRHVVVVEDRASATLIETHIGPARAYLSNSAVDVLLGQCARLDRIKVQMEGGQAVHLASFDARLGADARLRDFTLTRGGRATRQQGRITFTGEGGEAKIAGAYLLAGRQHADTRIIVDHAVPHCTSRELFKCVMDGDARGVFQGKVIVQPDAQKTDGKQSSHALLLSETAEFDAKPELEIFADDVVCGHGATSGALEEDHLFYLRARGIPLEEAKSLLIAAFAAEAFDQVENEAVREVLTGLAEGWLTSQGR